jgi:predicted nucleotidyltransferase
VNVKELIAILQRMPSEARVTMVDRERSVSAEIRGAGYMDSSVRLSSTDWVRPSQVLAANRDRIVEILTGFGFTRPRVFGSVLRGTDNELSDLDLLVEVPEGATLFDLAAASMALNKCLGILVDLQTTGALLERFRDQILREAKPL